MEGEFELEMTCARDVLFWRESISTTLFLDISLSRSISSSLLAASLPHARISNPPNPTHNLSKHLIPPTHTLPPTPTNQPTNLSPFLPLSLSLHQPRCRC